MVVFDCILNKIVYHPVNQNVTSDHRGIFTVPDQFYLLFLGKRFQIHQYFIDEGVNGNGFILGVSGSGKSFAAKREITEIALSTNDDIIIIDPEAEYRPLVEGLGGEVIEISPNSQHHINPLDLQDGYEDGENPIAMKSELITSILEQQMGAGLLSGSQKSIIDRCTASVY